MPLPVIPVPTNVPQAIEGKSNPATPGDDPAVPWIGVLTVPKKGFFSRGAHVTIGVVGDDLTIAGLYRFAKEIRGENGIMASPALKDGRAGPAALRHWNSRNVAAGQYYLVIWGKMPDGAFGGISSPVQYLLQFGNWRIW